MSLKLEKLCGGYGARQVIKDVTAEFREGELVAVIGANGCGKSTLLRLCAGLLVPTDGHVMADGEDILKMGQSDRAKKISYLPQTKAPPRITVRSLVSHGRYPYLSYPRRYKADDLTAIESAMELAGVTDISERLLSELSGGQQQRAYIGMTLAQSTDVLLLDEPLTFLDINHQLEIMELLVKLRSMSKTVIAVMHDLTLAFSYADRIAVMCGDRLVSLDTPENTASGDATFKALGVYAKYSADSGRYYFVGE